MKNYSHIIELINQYISQTLSQNEKDAFESRLESDSEFKAVFQEQLVIIEGIKRTGLKQEILVAKHRYSQAKWLKMLGVSGFFIMLLLFTWLYINNQQKTNNQTPNQPVATQISDTIPTDKTQIIERAQVDSVVVETVTKNEINSVTDIQKATSEKKIVHSKNDFQEKTISQDSIKSKTSKIVFTANDGMLKSFFETVKKKPQVIQVNTREASTITLQEGTVLNIPAHAFVDAKTGNLARGTIQLEVTEYYKLSDMLLGDLSTISNDSQLETGGMLFMEAFKNNTLLKLSKPLQIGFPYKNEKPDMQLFSGDKSSGNMNWDLESTRIKKNETNKVNTIVPVNEGFIEVPFDVVEIAPVFPGCEALSNMELKACFNSKVNTFVTENFNLELAEKLRLTGSNEIKAFFKISPTGDIVDINVSASSVRLGEAFVRVINLMPKLRPGLQRGKPVTVHYYMPFKFDLPGKTVTRSFITVKSNQVLNSKFDKPMDSISVNNSTVYKTYEVSNYAFSSAKMGWINCDRFVRDRKQKVKFKFKIKHADGANVKMVFKSISSILPGKISQGDVSFGLVPIDEEVILVAIKKIEDTLYLGIKDINTQNTPELDFEFKPVTIKALKQQLIDLNTLFD